MLPFDPRPLPDLSGMPVLLIAAHDDELIPVERAGLLAALLGEAGADVTYEVLHAGHGLTGEDLKLASEWLASAAVDCGNRERHERQDRHPAIS